MVAVAYEYDPLAFAISADVSEGLLVLRVDDSERRPVRCEHKGLEWRGDGAAAV